MASLSECVHCGVELKIRKMLQKHLKMLWSGSSYLQKEKKGGFSLLPKSQVRGTNKYKGRSQLRILSVGCGCVFFFFLCSSFFIVKQNNCPQRATELSRLLVSQLALKSLPTLCTGREELSEGKSRDFETNEVFRR